MRFQRSYRIGAISGIPVFVHWSTIAVVTLICLLAASGGVPLLFLAGSLFALILAHELGHASLARRLGYRVHRIVLSPIHGQCFYDTPRSQYDSSYVAWGGVCAQLAILIPAATLWSLSGSWLPNVLNLSFVILTYYNVAIIALNLAPIRPFDGATAWGLFAARSTRAHRPKRRR